MCVTLRNASSSKMIVIILRRAVTIKVQCILRNMQSLHMNTCLITPVRDSRVTQLCVLKRDCWEPMTSPRVITKECTLSPPLIFSLWLLHIKSNRRQRCRVVADWVQEQMVWNMFLSHFKQIAMYSWPPDQIISITKCINAQINWSHGACSIKEKNYKHGFDLYACRYVKNKHRFLFC